jgi:hypothetical protein
VRFPRPHPLSAGAGRVGLGALASPEAGCCIAATGIGDLQAVGDFLRDAATRADIDVACARLHFRTFLEPECLPCSTCADSTISPSA